MFKPFLLFIRLGFLAIFGGIFVYYGGDEIGPRWEGILLIIVGVAMVIFGMLRRPKSNKPAPDKTK